MAKKTFGGGTNKRKVKRDPLNIVPAGYNPFGILPTAPGPASYVPAFTPVPAGFVAPTSYAPGVSGYNPFAQPTQPTQPATNIQPIQPAQTVQQQPTMIGQANLVTNPATGGPMNVLYQDPNGYYGYTHPSVGGNVVYNSSGQGIGRVGASGLIWYNTSRQGGQNYRQLRAQAVAAGTWDKLRAQLQRRRDIMKYRGIGAGRPPETKGKIPMPGGSGNGGGGGGGGNDANTPIWYNDLVSWNI